MSTRFIVSAVVGAVVGYVTWSPQAGMAAFSLTPSVGLPIDAPRDPPSEVATGIETAPPTINLSTGHPT